MSWVQVPLPAPNDVIILHIFMRDLLLLSRIFKEAADPKAKVRNRGDVVFPAESSKVKDNEDHFPINSEDQARNALARANQYSSAPEWYSGSLSSLVSAVARAVKSKYKDIDVSEKSKKPGKG